MIRYVKHAYIDFTKYDLCVRLDPAHLIYGNSWYLNTVCENWDVLVLNDYDAVWPLPVRRKFGIKYFYRPFGIQQLGIFSKIPYNTNLVQEFVKALKKNCSYADIFMNTGQNVFENTPSITTSMNQNFVLDIGESYREIYKSYSKSLKRNLQKTSSGNWNIFENDSPEVLLNLFKENKGDKLKLKNEFYKTMEKIMYRCLHNGHGHLWTLYAEGNEACAGIFVCRFRDKLTLLFTGLNSQGRAIGAMPYLLNEYIIFQSEKFRYFDFEGSNDYNVAQFYSRFGSHRETYAGLMYNGLPSIISWLK